MALWPFAAPLFFSLHILFYNSDLKGSIDIYPVNSFQQYRKYQLRKPVGGTAARWQRRASHSHANSSLERENTNTQKEIVVFRTYEYEYESNRAQPR